MTRPYRSPLRRIVAAFLTVPLVATGLLVLAAPAGAATVRAFTPYFTANTTGDIMLTGNTLMTCPAGSTSTDASHISCATAQGPGPTGANNFFTMVNVDVDSDPTTFNSSSATVTIPSGATVLSADLSWAANTSAGTSGSAAPNAANKGIVVMKPPNGSYATLTSSRTDVSGTTYQGFADVTAAVVAGGSGTYTVGNVQAGTGMDRYAGWSLAIAYRDPTQPTRNLVIYTGYGTVTSTDHDLAVPISGFTTPQTGAVVTRIGVVAYEGDRGVTGDSLTLNSTSISNAANPVSDIFNSTATDLGVAISSRTPSYANLLGVDIDRFDASGILANGATSATVTFKTLASGGETYYPGLLSFATNLYAPTLTATKTVTDVNGGTVAPGDVLNYSIGVTNTGGDASVGSVLTDSIPVGSSYVPGSLTVGGVAVTDAAGDDVGSVAGGVVTARMGSGATSSAGGRLAPNAATTVAFEVTVNPADADGTSIVNQAGLAYSGETTGTAFTGSSNSVTSAVVVPPALTFAAPPGGQVGSAYNDQLTEAGGTGPYVWSVGAGTLPAGLALDSSTGLLSGTPTTAGSSTFTVQVTDANARSDTRSVTLVVSRATSGVTLGSSVATVHRGGTVTLTATVAPGAATGSVSFSDERTSGPQTGTTITLGTSTVSAGVATLTVPLVSYGNNVITASYGGDGNNAASSSPTSTIAVNAAVGDVIVREFRLSGPGGTADQYVELYNASTSALPLAGFQVQSSSGASVTLPAASLSVGRSYLLTGSGYSLGAVAHSDDGVTSLGSGGIRVVAPDSAVTVTDAVGPDADGYSSGTPLAAMSAAPTDQYAWVRVQTTGQVKNTGNNSTDFALVSTTGGVVGGVQSMVGSPSPIGQSDAYRQTTALASTLLDPSKSATVVPNRVVVAGSAGRPTTLTIRRVITNTSSSTMSVVKLRIVSLSEADGLSQSGVPGQGGSSAKLRVVNPLTSTSLVTVGGSVKTVQNLSIDSPAVTSVGGGLNTTLTAPLGSGGLAPGATVTVALTFAADVGGTYWFVYDVDAAVAS